MIADADTAAAPISAGAPPRPRRPAADLISPSAELTSCVRAYISRSTVGTALASAQRLNHFPATATCALIWVLEGRLESICAMDGAAAPQLLPGGVLFRGPQSRPFATRSSGPVRAFMCLLMPDALHAVAGLKPAAWTNRAVAMDAALGPPWQAMARAVHDAPDDAARVACIEAFLLPRWREVRRAGHVSVDCYQDWAQCLRARAQASGPGQSERQMERRIKGLAGLTWRDIRAIGQAESVFRRAGDMAQAGPLTWASVASDAGYADQAHLCRSIRKASGFTPTELHSRARFDEAFWVYRLSRLWR
jgi:AraC-like DNA-binding protein